MDYISYISLAVSLLAFGGGVYTYFAHDKKLKKQQDLLNELNIEKLKSDNQESKKANIRVSLIENAIDKNDIFKYGINPSFQRTGRLSVVNLGKATAFEINIFITGNWLQHPTSLYIEQLVSNEKREYNIEWNEQGFNSKTVIVKWNDAYESNRSVEIKL